MDTPINLWKWLDRALLTNQGTLVILAGKGPQRIYAREPMNKDDILTDEQQLALLIRDAMSEFARRRLGIVSVNDSQDEVMKAAMEYAASKLPRDEDDTSVRELRAKHAKQKAEQTIARCQAADLLYHLSSELAGLIVEMHKRSLAIIDDLNYDFREVLGPVAEPSLIEAGRRSTMEILNKARIRDLAFKINAAHNAGRLKAEDEVLGWIIRLFELTHHEPVDEDPPEPEDTADDPYGEYPQDFGP